MNSGGADANGVDEDGDLRADEVRVERAVPTGDFLFLGVLRPMATYLKNGSEKA